MRQLGHSVSYFCVLAEHDRRASTDQQIGGVTNNGVGRDARECIAATTLHANYQFADWNRFSLPSVQALQMRLGTFDNVLNHAHKTHMLFVLQANGMWAIALGLRGH